VLGYTRVTMVETKSNKKEIFSKSLKSTLVLIVLWNSRAWSWNR